jgi:hypothetical protein
MILQASRPTPLLAGAVLVSAAAAACGATVVRTDAAGVGGSGVTTVVVDGVSSGAGGTGGGGGHIEPPPPPMGGPQAGDGSLVLAITRLYLGDTDRDGTPDKADGWKRYGFDLDGQSSTATSTGLCKPRDDAPVQHVYPDGEGGIDNAFGKSILPILLGISTDFSQQQNDGLLQGKPTLLFSLQLGAGASYAAVPAAAYQGASLGMPPKLDGTDSWPVDPASLLDPAVIGSPRTTFSESYLVDDTWVGRTSGTLSLTFGATDFALRLDIQHAVVTIDLDASHQRGTNGTIAGVLSTAALSMALRTAAGDFDPILCESPTIDGLTSQIEQAADILQDGTQNPALPCDGISIGIGFDAVAVQLGPIGPPAPPPPNPCQ